MFLRDVYNNGTFFFSCFQGKKTSGRSGNKVVQAVPAVKKYRKNISLFELATSQVCDIFLTLCEFFFWVRKPLRDTTSHRLHSHFQGLHHGGWCHKGKRGHGEFVEYRVEVLYVLK